MVEADLAAADDLVRRAFAALPSATPTASQLKVKMCELQPGFDEKSLGFEGSRGFLAHLPERVRVIGRLGGDVIVPDDRAMSSP
jgi:hypothetical protein